MIKLTQASQLSSGTISTRKPVHLARTNTKLLLFTRSAFSSNFQVVVWRAFYMKEHNIEHPGPTSTFIISCRRNTTPLLHIICSTINQHSLSLSFITTHSTSIGFSLSSKDALIPKQQQQHISEANCDKWIDDSEQVWNGLQCHLFLDQTVLSWSLIRPYNRLTPQRRRDYENVWVQLKATETTQESSLEFKKKKKVTVQHIWVSSCFVSFRWR